MPALVACGRAWEFGSDDLVFPGIASLLLRVFWVLCVSAGVAYFRSALLCQHLHTLVSFAFAVLGISAVVIIIECAIIFFSARGTVVKTKPRKPVVHLLHFRIVVLIIEVLLLILGSVFVFLSDNKTTEEDCSDLDDAYLACRIIVAANWGLLFLFTLIAVIYLDPCHCYSAKVNYSTVERRVKLGSVDDELVETQWRLNHSVWEKRFRVACCFTGSDDSHQVAYREVAEIFAHLFCNTNVVPSDIAAGLILLQKEHLAREEMERNDETDSETTALNFHDPVEREAFKNALHYLKYALGMYTWPIFVYMNPLCGFCRLYPMLQCCCAQAKTNVAKDNSCSCHLAGVRNATGLSDADIIYVSFKNGLFEVPYMVCLDHETQSVVIAFRGTLSFPDIVTDLTAGTKPIELPDFPDFLVHKGMLKTVLSVIQYLDDEGILTTAFSKVSDAYNLVIVGHSLGSGCACILSMMLRQRYPNLHCYCYSPTGALLNQAAAEHTKDFVTSVTLGRDLVARLSIRTTHALKDDVVRVLESCRKPKYRILLEGALETVSTCFGKSYVFEEPLPGEDPEAPPPSSPTTASNGRLPTGDHHEEEEEEEEVEVRPNNPEESLEITPLLNKRMSSLALPHLRNSTSPVPPDVTEPFVPLFLPGRVIHIVDSGETKACFCGARQLEPRWSSQNNFSRIAISAEMIRDHLPDQLCKAMEKIWSQKTSEIEDQTISRLQV